MLPAMEVRNLFFFFLEVRNLLLGHQGNPRPPTIFDQECTVVEYHPPKLKPPEISECELGNTAFADDASSVDAITGVLSRGEETHTEKKAT